MIPPGVRISDAHWSHLMGALRDGHDAIARSFLMTWYAMSDSEAEAWVVAVVAAKAWNL